MAAQPSMRATQTLTVPGTLAGIRDAVEAFIRFGSAHGVPPGAAWRFQLALDEILSNIIRHGGPAAARPIELIFASGTDAVSLEIVDSAPAFDPLQAPAPDTAAPLERRAAGGLGISLVRGLMDDTHYERRGDRNHLSMTWHLNNVDK